MEKENIKTNYSEGTVEKSLQQNGENASISHDSSFAKKKLISKLRFFGNVILILIVFLSGAYVGHQYRYELPFGRALKFMTPKQELTVDQFSEDPISNRDLAWNSEDMPGFISSDFNKASLLNYDGVEYAFGENKIYIEREFLSNDELSLVVNMEFGWLMSNFSIYSSGENISIYGYWNDEFRNITLGKTKESITRKVLTLNPGVPFSANGKYISEDVKDDYIFVIGEDMRTVSAYKDKAIVGEAVVLPDEILGFYDQIMILAKSDAYIDKLYMPYVVDNNGNEEFICIEIATVTSEEVNNVSDTEHMDTFQSYITKYSARMGYTYCYIFENGDGTVKMRVPNDIQKYAAYRRGTDVLKPDDDLGWHWVTIYE